MVKTLSQKPKTYLPLIVGGGWVEKKSGLVYVSRNLSYFPEGTDLLILTSWKFNYKGQT